MADCTININWEDMNLDYEGENKFSSFFSSNGNIHSYPAKAVPEMVNDLLKKVISIYPIQRVLDPFVGSGTTALESKYLGLDFWGSDLNPLAVLLSKTKSLTIENTNYVKKRLNEFIIKINQEYEYTNLIPVVDFPKIDYWFKEENIKQLEYLKFKIDKFIKNSNKVNRETYALILLTAFSSTIRRVSLTRNGEFKLYRMAKNEINKFSINAIIEFTDAVNNLLDMLVVANDNYIRDTSSNIYLKNAKSLDYLENNSIDMVITSPPYGDSKTTVAYGEFSKLSIEWTKDLLKKYIKIDIDECNCDEQLLGGRKSQWNLIDEKNFYLSVNMSNLVKSMDERILEVQSEIEDSKIILELILQQIKKNNYVNQDLLTKNQMLYNLIYERVRLYIYRKINNSTNLNNKKIKKLAKLHASNFMMQLTDCTSRKYIKRQNALIHILDKVTETLDRKNKSTIKRKEEVIIFMKDLYKVVVETNRVLRNEGIQVWIVGHRTIMGKIVIDMESIIKDWFTNIGYECEASLNRKYSFKRMPHHINSTINRNEEVSTMMNEYILVVRKNSLENVIEA